MIVDRYSVCRMKRQREGSESRLSRGESINYKIRCVYTLAFILEKIIASWGSGVRTSGGVTRGVTSRDVS